MAQLSLQHIQKIYDNQVHVVKDFNLEIADKEFIVFVGPSGCGKSTTLRMIAGLEEISGGDLLIDGKRMNDVPAKARNIAMVFQNYALYPHMTVYDNMAFGLKMQKIAKEVIDERVNWAAQILGLREYLKRKPGALSGGQRQRVALGRAIVREAGVFLMDEPLSNYLPLTLGNHSVTPYTRIGLDRWSNWDWQDDIEREGHDFNRVGLFYGYDFQNGLSVSLEYAFEWQDHDEGDSDKFHYAGVGVNYSF